MPALGCRTRPGPAPRKQPAAAGRGLGVNAVALGVPGQEPAQSAALAEMTRSTVWPRRPKNTAIGSHARAGRLDNHDQLGGWLGTGRGRVGLGVAGPARPADPPAARAAQGVDDPQAVVPARRPATSQRTLRRRARQTAAWRRPRLVAKADPDRDQILAELHQQLRDLPDGAVVLAEDETHINLLPWVRATWIARGTRQEVRTRAPTDAAHLRRCRPAHWPLPVPGHPQRRQRQLHRVLRAAPGGLRGCADRDGALRQRHHPPLQDRTAVAGSPSADAGAAWRPLQPPRQPRRADLALLAGQVQPPPSHMEVARQQLQLKRPHRR
jgi:hypothetical protein